MIDDTLTWKSYIEMIIPKINVACFAFRVPKPLVTQDTSNMVYHSYFLSLIKYGIIFWGNSSYSNSIFKQQKRIIRIIMGVGIKDYCREFFKNIKYFTTDFTIYSLSPNNRGHRGSTVVKVLCYKSEGRWFDPSWCQWIFHWHKTLPIAPWPWGRLSLEQKWVPGVFPGGKSGRCVRPTTLPPSCAVVTKSWNLNFLEPSGPVQACNGTALPNNRS